MSKPVDTSYLMVLQRPDASAADRRSRSTARRARPRPQGARSSPRDTVRRSWALVQEIVEYRRLRAAVLGQPASAWADVQRLAELDAKFMEPSARQLRRFRRFRCNLLGWIRRSGESQRADIVLVEDISAVGAKLASNPGLQVGDALTLTFRVSQAPRARTVTFGARVARVDADGVGLRLCASQPTAVPVAVRNAA